MLKVIPGGVTGYRRSPKERRPTPNYSRKARMLRIKQTNGLNFSTAKPTLSSASTVMPGFS